MNTSAKPSGLAPGTVVAGRYEIVSELGRGGYAIVYKAVNQGNGEQVALKTIHSELAANEAYRERFRREQNRISKADVLHRNVCPVTDWGEEGDGLLWLAMKLIEGRTLEDLVSAEGPLPPDRAAHLIRQAADGLHAAHTEGEEKLVHRDVRPKNLMVTPSDRVFVIDFGIAKAYESSPEDTPLQHAENMWWPLDTEVRPATDVYSLGLVLAYTLTGAAPVNRQPTFPSNFTVDRRLRRVIEHATAPDSRKRPSAEELSGELADAVAPRRRFWRRRSGAAPAASRPPSAPHVLASDAPTAPVRRTPKRPAQAGSGKPATKPLETKPAARPPKTTAEPPKAAAKAPEAGGERASARNPPASATREKAKDRRQAAAKRQAATRQRTAERRRAAARRRRSGRLGRVRALVPIGVVVLIAPGLGTAAGVLSSPNTSTGNVQVGPIKLDFADPWKPSDAGSWPPVALAYGSLPGARLLLAWASADGEMRRPDRTRPTTVEIGPHTGLSYPIALLGERRNGFRASSFLVPTLDGYAAFTCESPAKRFKQFEKLCNGLIAQARLTGTRAVPPSPIPAFAARLRKALAELRTARLQQSAALGASSTGTRATGARQIAGAYATFGRAVRRSPVPVEDRFATEGVAEASGAVASAYRRLARALKGKNRDAYRRIAGTVDRRTQKLRRALGGLRTTGYDVERS